MRARRLDTCRLTGTVLVIAKLERLARDAPFLLRLEKAAVDCVAADMPNANRLTLRLMAIIAQEGREDDSRVHQGRILRCESPRMPRIGGLLGCDPASPFRLR